jgi:hypothetical protein
MQNRMEKLVSVEVDGDLIYKSEIEKMNYEQLHMLVSFLETEKDLNKIKNWSKNELIHVYIDNLISNISRLESKWQ